MKRVLVRYTVKPAKAAENEELVSAVHDEAPPRSYRRYTQRTI
jgi:hypothetical protein